ncbi:MAG: DUF2795 domain-containing protein [Halohasta sp.]
MRLPRTEDAFVDHSYPASTAELVAAYGDSEITLPNGTETVGEILGRMGDDTYENSEAVSQALLTGVSHKAIGRRFYSDRDQFTPGEHGPEQVSF